MKTDHKSFRTFGAIALLGVTLTGCSSGESGKNMEHPVSAAEETTTKDRDSGDIISVRGLLRHSPQDVKSTEAWLGHEFMVGETPIRPTEKVPREVLMKMVGEEVEIEGLWNAGKKWEPPKPAEEGFQLQNPSYPEGVTVITGSGIEASSVKKVEK